MGNKLGRDNTKVKDEVIEKLAYHLASIDKLLRENDQRSYTGENDKSVDMMVNAICFKSRNFDQANRFAANLSGLLQHTQSETCGLSGSSKRNPTIGDQAKHFIQTSAEIWLNMRGEGGKRVEGEVQVKAKQHDIPWRMQGECKDCVYQEKPIRKSSLGDSWNDPCSGCGYENPKFKAKK